MTDESENYTGFTRKKDSTYEADLPHLYDFSLPFQFKERMFNLIDQMKGINFEKVISFLESRLPPLEFEYAGYDRPGIELKTIEKIKGIFLMINPDPRVFEVIPPESMVICHHKISVQK